MKLQDTPHKKSWLVAVLAAAVVAALALAAFSPFNAPVYAEAGGTPGAPGEQGQGAGKALEKFLQREQHVLDSLDHRFEVADKVAAKVQAWIDKQKAAGKDTAGLEAGLAAFNAQVAAAKAYRDQAASLLQSPAGFDANGAVTDPQQARDTVKAIREALRNAHKALVKAVPDLRHAINDYRKANHLPGGDDQGDQGQGNQGQGHGHGNGGQGDDEGTETPEPTETPGG